MQTRECKVSHPNTFRYYGSILSALDIQRLMMTQLNLKGNLESFSKIRELLMNWLTTKTPLMLELKNNLITFYTQKIWRRRKNSEDGENNLLNLIHCLLRMEVNRRRETMGTRNHKITDIRNMEFPHGTQNLKINLIE